MDSYIGLDAHAASCTVGVVTPKGRRIGSQAIGASGALRVGGRCLAQRSRWPSPSSREKLNVVRGA